MAYTLPKDKKTFDELNSLNEQLLKRFGEEIPTLEMPPWETLEGAMEKAREGLRIGKYSIKELYGIDYSDGNIYA